MIEPSDTLTSPKSKNKKNPPRKKNSLYMGRWNFLVKILKKIPYILLEENFFRFSQKRNPVVSIPNHPPPPPPKKTKKTDRERHFLVLILKKFVYFLIFPETELSSSNINILMFPIT